MGRSGLTVTLSSLPSYFSDAPDKKGVGDRIFNITINGTGLVNLYNGLSGTLVARIPEGTMFRDFGEVGLTFPNGCYIDTAVAAAAVTSVSITGVTEII